MKSIKTMSRFMEKDPSELIRKLKPKYFIKGSDYKATLSSLPELTAINEAGARLIIYPVPKKYSSGILVSCETGIHLQHSENSST